MKRYVKKDVMKIRKHCENNGKGWKINKYE